MDAVFLGYLGLALVLGLSGIGSIYGVSITANAGIGSLKKNPDLFGYYMILMTPPATNGLYGFLGYFIMSDLVTPEITWFQASGVFAACLALGALNLFSAPRQAQACANGMAAISGGKPELFGKSLMLIVFIELYAIIGLAALFLVYGAL